MKKKVREKPWKKQNRNFKIGKREMEQGLERSELFVCRSKSSPIDDGASIVTQQLRCRLQPQHATWVLVQVPSALLLIQLLAKVSGWATEDGPSPYSPASMWMWETQLKLLTHSSYLWLGLVPVIETIWEVHQQMQDLSLSLSLSLFLSLFPLWNSNFQINKWNSKTFKKEKVICKH